MELTTKVQRKRGGFRRNALGLLTTVIAITIARAAHAPWIFFIVPLLTIPQAWRDRTRARRVVASRAGLQLDGELVVRDAFLNGTVYVDDVAWVTLEMADGSINIAVPDEKRGRKLLRALGLHESAMRIRVTTRRHSTSAWGLMIPLVVIGLYASAMYFREHFGTFMTTFFGFAIMLAIVDIYVRRVEVIVGIDGISVKGRQGARFVPYSSVGKVSSNGRLVTVTLEGEDPLQWDAIVHPRAHLRARATALVAWIERAREHWATNPEPRRVDELGHGAFRQSHVSDEALWDALRSGKTRVSDRVVAAATLRQRVADDDVIRLRGAADALASPARERVRAVLDADDADLEQLVDDLAAIVD